jgi:bacteriocin leader peptide (microcyclamide/patellamide family)
MDKKNLMPQATQLINRTTTQEMPDVLAGIEELDEEALVPSVWWAGNSTAATGKTTNCSLVRTWASSWAMKKDSHPAHA